jgi:hypothetical protein
VSTRSRSAPRPRARVAGDPRPAACASSKPSSSKRHAAKAKADPVSTSALALVTSHLKNVPLPASSSPTPLRPGHAPTPTPRLSQADSYALAQLQRQFVLARAERAGRAQRPGPGTIDRGASSVGARAISPAPGDAGDLGAKAHSRVGAEPSLLPAVLSSFPLPPLGAGSALLQPPGQTAKPPPMSIPHLEPVFQPYTRLADSSAPFPALTRTHSPAVGSGGEGVEEITPEGVGSGGAGLVDGRERSKQAGAEARLSPDSRSTRSAVARWGKSMWSEAKEGAGAGSEGPASHLAVSGAAKAEAGARASRCGSRARRVALNR